MKTSNPDSYKLSRLVGNNSAVTLSDYVCVFLDAVRLNALTKNASNAEIEFVIKDWLRAASSRSGSSTPVVRYVVASGKTHTRGMAVENGFDDVESNF